MERLKHAAPLVPAPGQWRRHQQQVQQHFRCSRRNNKMALRMYFGSIFCTIQSMCVVHDEKKNISKNRESVGLLSNSHKDVDALFKLDRRQLESLVFFHMSDYSLQVNLVCEGCASRAPCSSTERQGTRALVWKAAPVLGRCCSRNGSRHGGVGVKKLWMSRCLELLSGPFQRRRFIRALQQTNGCANQIRPVKNSRLNIRNYILLCSVAVLCLEETELKRIRNVLVLCMERVSGLLLQPLPSCTRCNCWSSASLWGLTRGTASQVVFSGVCSGGCSP